MNKAKVSIEKVADYNREAICTALKRSLSLLGGLENIIKPRSKVFVKINHLSPPSSPDDAVVTHPYFTKEVLRLLLELSLDITVGDDIRSVEVRNFRHSAVAVGFMKRKIPSFLHGFIQAQLTLTPKINMKKCTACMECVKICPKEAAKLDGDLVWIDRSLCIHCMCCHEVCRFQAIKLGQRPLGRIFREANDFYRKAKSLFA
jgi:NAD-dependent dihydropyrimidine dehydrogenase PreA subunit